MGVGTARFDIHIPSSVLNTDLRSTSFSGSVHDFSSTGSAMAHNSTIIGISAQDTAIAQCAAWESQGSALLELNINGQNFKSKRSGWSNTTRLQYPFFVRSEEDSSGTVIGVIKAYSTSCTQTVSSGTFNFKPASGSQSAHIRVVLTYFTPEAEDQTAPSTFYLDKSSVTATGNDIITATVVNNDLDQQTHNIEWSQVGETVTQENIKLDEKGKTSFKIPKEWNSQILYSTPMTATCRLYTYKDGNLKGVDSATFSVFPDPSLRPRITGCQTEVAPGNTGLNFYVQTITGVKITIPADNVELAYGSPIQQYTINGVTTTNNTHTVSKLPNSGTCTFFVTVTDARGATSEQYTVEVENVVEYKAPTVRSSTAVRTLASREANVRGTFCVFQTDYSFSEVKYNKENHNEVTVTVSFAVDAENPTYSAVTPRTIPTDENVQGNILPQVAYMFGSADSSNAEYLDTTKNYQIRFRAVDRYGGVGERIVSLDTTDYTMFFKRGGNGVAFGQETLSSTDALEVNPQWEILHGSYVVPHIAYVESATAYNNLIKDMPEYAKAGMIILRRA